MKLIPTTQAVGHVLCHDITQIIKGVKKGPVFRKGHIVREEDIPVLLSTGKENLYVYEKQEGMLHEDEAAAVLCEICAGENMMGSGPSEGKIEIFAACDGLLRVDAEKLRRVNSLGDMMIATRRGSRPVRAGDKLAGTRVIPLVIAAERMEKAREIGGGVPILSLLPYIPVEYGLIVTGNEVASGRIQDTFTPVVVDKMAEYGARMKERAVPGDDGPAITEAILRMKKDGCGMVLCTGGMSVDPDDKTPLAIKNTGADIVSYGSPVLPGAMFLLSYLDGIPVLGLPGCVMYERRTIFDLVLPHLLAGVKMTAADLAGLGHGGLCLSCKSCVFPDCAFGTGL